MNVTLGLLQHACVAEPRANQRKTLALIERAAKQGAQIICTQELFRSQYFCQAEDYANFALAEPVPGPTTAALQKLAKKHGVVIVASLFERRTQGLYHNTAAVIDADGSLLGIYRKMHIPDDPLFYEKFYFTPGDLGYRAWQTRFGRIGVLICWDQWYPEAARLTALQGAEVLFYPTAIGWHPREPAELGAKQHGAWETIQRAHAVANGCYVAAVNRIGFEDPYGGDGIRFWGQSFVAGTQGEILAKAAVDREEVLLVPVDLGRIDDTRTHWPFLRDRRIDTFGDLTRRLPACRPPRRQAGSLRTIVAPTSQSKTIIRKSKIPAATAATPAALGYRMPAEWEPQAAVWFSWPHRLKTWPRHFRPIPAKFAEIIATISRFEDVRVNCTRRLQPRARRLCERAGAVMERVTFFDHATDDAWCRDHGPIFVKHTRTGEVALTDWGFNAWGEKYPAWSKDDAIPRRIERVLGLRRFEIPMILEGGSIDVNGEGLLLTTESCLLNPNRNPQLAREQIEQALRDQLGVREIIWLGDGIAGDDTDGHVDDLTRFFKADGIVTAVESNARDENYRPLADNLERLKSLRTPQGRRFDVRTLPMPRALHGRGQRLPASYANFLIINGAVIVPIFGQPRRDAEALEVLRECFPGREVIGIDCRDLVLGLGTLHCISQQQPA